MNGTPFTCVCGVTETRFSIAPVARPDLCGSCWIASTEPERPRLKREKAPVTTTLTEDPVALATRETSAHATEANAVKAALADFPVTTKEQIELASGILVDVKGKARALEERLQEITRPLNAALASVRDLFRPALNAYSEVEVLLKRRIADAHMAIERANREAMEAAAAQMAAGNVLAAAQAATSMVERPAAEGVRTQEILTYRVVNALEVPREFLTVDDKKVRAHLAAHGEASKIPGIVIEKDVRIIAARGRA